MLPISNWMLKNAVVLDTRGNNGGDSWVGFRLLSALLKETSSIDEPDHESPKAYWRVSSLARTTLDAGRASALQTQGKESSSYKWLVGMLESMDAAALRGDPFAEQIDLSSEDDEEARKIPPQITPRTKASSS
ncbi:hypothetical protein FQR65_LT07997 [Abscondita terminalis]|nr:hypothetical protein FQR65_LT07997 [Abscondita terminalis]